MIPGSGTRKLLFNTAKMLSGLRLRTQLWTLQRQRLKANYNKICTKHCKRSGRNHGKLGNQVFVNCLTRAIHVKANTGGTMKI